MLEENIKDQSQILNENIFIYNQSPTQIIHNCIEYKDFQRCTNLYIFYKVA